MAPSKAFFTCTATGGGVGCSFSSGGLRHLRALDSLTNHTLQTRLWLQFHPAQRYSRCLPFLSQTGPRTFCTNSSGSDDTTPRVWDLKDEKEILTFTLDATVTACIAAQDNRTIVAGDGFGRVHFLWLVEADKTKPAPSEIKIPLLRNSG